MSAVAKDLASLYQKTQGLDKNSRRIAVGVFLRYHMKSILTMKDAKAFLRELMKEYGWNQAASDISLDDLQDCLDMIGKGSGYLMPDNSADAVLLLKNELARLRTDLAELQRSKSQRTIGEYVAMMKAEQHQRKENTEASLEELLSTMLGAFKPEDILRRVAADEEESKWIEKNALFQTVQQKYKNIEQYKSSGKFVRDFWIMYKLKQVSGR